MSLLVSVDWLDAHLHEPGIRILHVGEDGLTYALGHIPGAASLVWDFWAHRPADLLDAARFVDLMSSLGVDEETYVVLYSDQANVWAGYAAWLLRAWGHEGVALLDGGFQGWAAAGHPLVTEPVGLTVTRYPPPRRVTPALRADRVDLAAALAGGVVIDVRIEGEYRGEVVPDLADRPVHPARRGRIPGAVNVPWTSLVDDVTGCLRPPSVLRAGFEDVGVRWDQSVVTYCLMGAGSAFTTMVLTEHLGHPDVRNYDRSWLEWSAQAEPPIES